jgi:hypothetical protein
LTLLVLLLDALAHLFRGVFPFCIIWSLYPAIFGQATPSAFGRVRLALTVDVIYDPADISQLTIEYEGHQPFKAKELVIGERSAPRPKLPEHLQKAPADSSRLLNAAARKNQERKESQPPAISYRSVRKGGKDNV